MKLYLVRHGQSTGNIGGTLSGQSDHPLTELGEAQAPTMCSAVATARGRSLQCTGMGPKGASRAAAARACASPSSVSGWSL